MIFSNRNLDSINLKELLDKKIKKRKLEQVLIIVPTNRKKRQLKKEIISEVPDQSTEQLNIETLSTLSANLLAVTKNFYPLSDPAATVLIKKSIEKIKLKYFTNYTENFPAGTLEKLKSVISEYKRQGFSPENVITDSSDLKISDKNKAHDISEIFKNFLKFF